MLDVTGGLSLLVHLPMLGCGVGGPMSVLHFYINWSSMQAGLAMNS